MGWAKSREVETYVVQEKSVNVHVGYNRRKDVFTAHTNRIKTPSQLQRAVEAISISAKTHSNYLLDQLLGRVKRDEVPHSEMLLKFGRPFRLGFDITDEGLGFFVEHDEIPDTEMLEVLSAAQGGMSGSDKMGVLQIKRRQHKRRQNT